MKKILLRTNRSNTARGWVGIPKWESRKQAARLQYFTLYSRLRRPGLAGRARCAEEELAHTPWFWHSTMSVLRSSERRAETRKKRYRQDSHGAETPPASYQRIVVWLAVPVFLHSYIPTFLNTYLGTY